MKTDIFSEGKTVDFEWSSTQNVSNLFKSLIIYEYDIISGSTYRFLVIEWCK